MRLVSLIMLVTCAAYAQLTDGVATSVTRTVLLTADEADFSLSASANRDTTQQQITQVFLDAGISGLTLTGTGVWPSYDPTIQTQVTYQFTFSVPAAGLKDTVKKMDALKTNPPDLLKGLQYSAVLNASPSTVDATRQTLLPQLFAEAQKKAQTLAAVAGLTLGAAKSMSESYYPTGSSSGTEYTFAAYFSFGLAAQ